MWPHPERLPGFPHDPNTLKDEGNQGKEGGRRQQNVTYVLCNGNTYEQPPPTKSKLMGNYHCGKFKNMLSTPVKKIVEYDSEHMRHFRRAEVNTNMQLCYVR